jgi:hypothetical protein
MLPTKNYVKLGVHIQVNPREINFFYLKDHPA